MHFKEGTALFSHSGFFFLRSPLLPFENLRSFSDDLLMSRDGADLLPDQYTLFWNQDMAMLEKRLIAMISDTAFRRALLMASPSLYRSLDRPLTSKQILQQRRSLIRYFSRACSRSTPMGLLAGCSLGTVASRHLITASPYIRLGPRSTYKLSHRLDFSVMERLVSVVASAGTHSQSHEYKINGTLHKAGNNYHILTSGSPQGPPTSLLRLTGDIYLDMLANLDQHSISRASLSTLLLRTINSSSLEYAVLVNSYIDDLVTQGVLASKWTPAALGKDPMAMAMEAIRENSLDCALIRRVDQLLEEVESLNSFQLARVKEGYDSIASSLADLGAITSDGSAERVIQVDMVKPIEFSHVDDKVAERLLGAAVFLDAAYPFNLDATHPIECFRRRFADRFGSTWVPLLTALDEETGVGFGPSLGEAPPSLLSELGSLRALPEKDQTLTYFQNKLLDKIYDARATGQPQIFVDENDLPPTMGPPSLPSSFALVATLIKVSENVQHHDNYEVLLRSGDGPSGVNMMARFCHAMPELESYLRRHLEHEEVLQPEVIFAEVAYLPQGRIGNVLFRPALHRYQIICEGNPDTPTYQHVALADILVTVSEQGDVLLQSRNLGRRIIPRLTTAHAFGNPLWSPIYMFLELVS